MAGLLRETLSQVLLYEVSDPALKGLLVTEVDLSPDLKHAKVFYSQHEQGIKEKEILKGFERALPFLKRRISQELDLRYIPELKFILDTHTDELNHLLSVMDTVHEERAT